MTSVIRSLFGLLYGWVRSWGVLNRRRRYRYRGSVWRSLINDRRPGDWN
ncbi:hypothetical protein LCGC14_1474000 [marine sediment metagenome]|uniref:Uncharacterized protein n=1 Tax=marine sediment metagenome TaxID=412755 RepID=A0A0F9JC72_9ZZZZ